MACNPDERSRDVLSHRRPSVADKAVGSWSSSRKASLLRAQRSGLGITDWAVAGGPFGLLGDPMTSIMPPVVAKYHEPHSATTLMLHPDG